MTQTVYMAVGSAVSEIAIIDSLNKTLTQSFNSNSPLKFTPQEAEADAAAHGSFDIKVFVITILPAPT